MLITLVYMLIMKQESEFLLEELKNELHKPQTFMVASE